MAYQIDFTNQAVDLNNKTPITVNVVSVNTTSTSLTLTGKGTPNYGEIQQENIVHILENFASPTAPPHPTIGQLWYDTSKGSLMILSSLDIGGTNPVWKASGGAQVTEIGSPPPINPSVGDMWFSKIGSTTGILYVYTGIGRYPSTSTAIGGWEQVHPDVQITAGREEYDEMRELLEQYIGEGISAYGSGAIGRTITSLTNFAELDRDLRSKYAAMVPDANVLVSPSSDLDITPQALSTTMFFHADSAGAVNGSNDVKVSGSVLNTTSAGTIYINGVSTSMPAGTVSNSLQVTDAYILWDVSGTLVPGAFYHSTRFNDVSKIWERDNDAGTWVTFTPSASMYIVGTFSTFQYDDNNISPGDRNGFLWAHAVPLVGSKIQHLKVLPNSQDWDELLAAAKYGIARLEVPSTFIKNISGTPFVVDGRPSTSNLLALPYNDVRYPTAARRAQKKIGSVSQHQNYAETLNALRIAVDNRFSLKGINGSTGTNPTFGPTVSVLPWASFSPTIVSGSTTSTTSRLKLRFASNDERSRWMSSGQGLQIQLSHVGGALIGDTNLRSLITAVGSLRITADKTRIYGSTLPLSVSRQNSNVGFWNAIQTGTIGTVQTVGVVTMTVKVFKVSEVQVDAEITLDASTPLSGTTTLTYSVIDDNENVSSVRVYPSPLTFTGSDTL
jgi:hypothetical protein